MPPINFTNITQTDGAVFKALSALFKRNDAVETQPEEYDGSWVFNLLVFLFIIGGFVIPGFSGSDQARVPDFAADRIAHNLEAQKRRSTSRLLEYDFKQIRIIDLALEEGFSRPVQTPDAGHVRILRALLKDCGGVAEKHLENLRAGQGRRQKSSEKCPLMRSRDAVTEQTHTSNRSNIEKRFETALGCMQLTCPACVEELLAEVRRVVARHGLRQAVDGRADVGTERVGNLESNVSQHWECEEERETRMQAFSSDSTESLIKWGTSG